jgi:hypothetical protein
MFNQKLSKNYSKLFKYKFQLNLKIKLNLYANFSDYPTKTHIIQQLTYKTRLITLTNTKNVFNPPFYQSPNY